MRAAVCRPRVCKLVIFTKNDRSVRSASQKFPDCGWCNRYWAVFSPVKQSLRSTLYTQGPQPLPLLLAVRDTVELRLRFRFPLQSASYDVLRPYIGILCSFALISHRFLHTKTLCSGLMNCTNLSHKICTPRCCISNCSANDSLNVLLQLYAFTALVIPIAFNMHYASADKSFNSFHDNNYLNQQLSSPS